MPNQVQETVSKSWAGIKLSLVDLLDFYGRKNLSVINLIDVDEHINNNKTYPVTIIEYAHH